MDPVVHFEIPAADVERAKAFYEKVFHWKINFVPGMNYNIIHTVEIDKQMMPTKPGTINGGMFKRSDKLDHPLLVIDVKDIHDSIHRLKEAGGMLLKEVQKVGDMGLVAYFKDTESNVLGLWQTLKPSHSN